MTLSVVFAIVMNTLLQVFQTVAMGALLGIGFWIAKQITSWLDEKRVMNDKDFMSELKNMGQPIPGI